MSAYLIAGVVASVAGLLTFLVIHHFWITPIWFILPVGLLISTLGGLSVGWSYAELHASLPPRPWTALAFATLIGLILAPSIVLAQLRAPLLDIATFTIPPGDGPRIATHIFLELVLTALLVGAAAGWFLAHTPRAAISTAMAAVAFALGPGHNIPLLGNTPALGKGLILILAITLVASAVLVEANAWLVRR